MSLQFEFPDYTGRIKEHVKKHKVKYLIGTHIVVAGVVYLVVRRITPAKISPTFNNTISPVFNNDNSSLVNFGGHTTKLVKRLEDDRIWEKVREAAKEAGVTPSYMSRHLNGHKPDIFGEHYQIIGVGTSG